MRHLTRSVAAGLLLTAALAACGTDDDEPQRTDATAGSTTTTEVVVGDVDPRAALLTPDDLAPEYAVLPAESSNDETPSGGCSELDNIDESTADDQRSAQVAFAGSELGPLIVHGVTEQDEGTAAREFENLRAALAKPECQSFQEQGDNGQMVTWTLETIRTARVGDDTIAFRLSGDAAAMYASADFAVERLGDNVSMIATTRVPMIGPLPPDLSALVVRAHQKLERAAAA
jgi:hypothetical protein